MLINRNDSLTDVLSNVSHELHRGALDRNHPFRFVNLSTLNQQNVNARLVVLRAVQEDLSFIIFTDKRSQKVADLTKNEAATLLFWHAGKKMQVSITGKAELHNQDALAEEYWSGISIEGRKAYGSRLAPAETVERPEQAHDWPNEIGSEFFSVIVVRPVKMEVLQLHKLSHYRAHFKHHKGEWGGDWLVP
ncbi:MAG: pyridoxamine 5'-phosphate oxidase family protein [Cyclobacteriaceae bacterium]